MAFGLSAASAALIGSVAAPVLGGLLGGSSSSVGPQTQTQTRDPWGPAQPYILDGLKRTKDLDNHYQANPFNDMQKQLYARQFGDADSFRSQMMPGLMNFANAGMTGGYQRGGSTIPQRSNVFSGRGLMDGPGGGMLDMSKLFSAPPVTRPEPTPEAAPLQTEDQTALAGLLADYRQRQSENMYGRGDR